jgi:hypothetical protein
MRSLSGGGSTAMLLAGVRLSLRRGYLRVVHIKKKPRYLLCSNSAMMQSTMCGLGVRMYIASMSRWVVRRSSRRSMSGLVRA